MQVTVGEELWVSQDDEGHLVLHSPTVKDRATGKGQPGLLVPKPYVLKPGTTVRLVPILDGARPANCTACVDIAFGRPPRNQIAHQHNHPPTR